LNRQNNYVGRSNWNVKIFCIVNAQAFYIIILMIQQNYISLSVSN